MDSDEEYVAAVDRDSSPEVFTDDEDLGGRRSRGKKSGSSGPAAADGGYSWEDRYKRPWDIVKDEDEAGQSLENVIQTMIENRKKKIMKNPTTPFQRGIIRTLIVIIDGSLTMLEKDLRPNRFAMTLQLLQEFIVEFFDQNPISQLGIVMMRNGVSNLVSEVNGLPQYHIDKLRLLRSRQHNRFEPKGDPLLQNSLEMARAMLKYNFGTNMDDNKNSKEVLILFGALFTSDPGDIHKTIDNLIKDEIKVKIIGLSAQVSICQQIANKTNNLGSRTTGANSSSGSNYSVIMNETHYRELLMDCVVPLPVAATEKRSTVGVPLIKMGFPLKVLPPISASNNTVNLDLPVLCACHPTNGSLESKDAVTIGAESSTSIIGYQCPQCRSRVCHLPTICPTCGLMLILSTHLARSYHHLVPLREYKEVPAADHYEGTHCYGCLLKFPEAGGPDGPLRASSRYRCPTCARDFCIDCDVFVHETLHNCPGCESRSGK